MVRNAKIEWYSTCDKTKSLLSRPVSHCDNYCHPKSLINSTLRYKKGHTKNCENLERLCLSDEC